jgi:hypothetical protein
MPRLVENGLGIASTSSSFDRRSMALRTVARFIL